MIDFTNSKKKKIISATIIIILALSLVVPMIISAFV